MQPLSRDALLRHELIHETQRNSSRKFRACGNCALSRVKCVGKAPCVRCRRKSINCVFPNRSDEDDGDFSSTASNVGDHQDMSHAKSPEIDDISNTSNLPIAQITNAALTLEHMSSAINNVGDVAINGPQMISSQNMEADQWPLQSSNILSPQTTQQTFGDSGNALGHPHRGQVLPRALPIDRQGDLYQMTPGQGYESQEASLNANAASSFNWLSPTFDFDFHDLQFVPPQAPPLSFSETPMYATSDIPPVSSAQQWQSLPVPIAHSHETPDASESSFRTGPTVEGVDAPEDMALDGDGAYYVEGTGARRPRNGKYGISPKSRPSLSTVQSPRTPGGFGFPDLGTSEEELVPHAEHIQMNPHAYQSMVAAFQELCVTPSTVFQTYNSPAFPSLAIFQRLIAQYTQCFNPNFPFLHIPSLRASTCPWLLILAMAAVGSQYASSCGMDTTVSLQEFLRRAILRYVSFDVFLPRVSSAILTDEDFGVD